MRLTCVIIFSDHLKHTGPDVESGLIVLGGAMLEEPIKEGVPPKMKGSVLMCVADTEEEVLERVKKDVYYTNGVWDKENVSAVDHERIWTSWIEDFWRTTTTDNKFVQWLRGYPC